MGKKTDIVIADDHAMLRAGLRALLDKQPDMRVVGEASDTQEAVEVVSRLEPHVVLMDLSMPGGGGVQAIGEVRREAPETKVLVLTMHEGEAYLRQVFEAGAAGYVVKRAADSELVAAIRAVVRGDRYVDPIVAGSIMGSSCKVWEGPSESNPVPPPGISKREEEVLRLVAAGHTSREVARRLCVSPKTVETHKSRACEKLGLRGRAALIRHAFEQGWLEEPLPETCCRGGDCPDGED